MNTQVLFPLISAILPLGLGCFVLSQNWKAILNRLFFAISLVFTIWLFGTFMMFVNYGNDALIIFWDRFVYIGVMMMPAVQYHFSLVFTHSTNIRRRLLIFSYLGGILFLILSRTNYFVDGVFRYNWGVHTIAQVGHHFFVVFFFFYVFAMLYNFYAQYKKEVSIFEKYKLQYLILAFAILDLIGGLGYLPAYQVAIFAPVALAAPLVFALLVAYVIVKHRFLNICIIVKRGLVYSILLSVAVAITGFVWLLLQQSFGSTWQDHSLLISAVWAVVLALILVPLRYAVGSVVNKMNFFYQYDWNELAAKVTKFIDSPEVMGFVGMVETEAQKAVSAKHVRIYLDKGDNDWHYLGEGQSDLKLKMSDLLVGFLRAHPQLLVREELEMQGIARQAIAGELKSLEIGMLAPIFINEHFHAVIVCGDKTDGIGYNADDIEVLENFASQMSWAMGTVWLYRASVERMKNDK